MGFAMHGRNGHRSAGAMDRYEIPEQTALGLGDKAMLYRNGRFVGYVDHAGVLRLGRGQNLAGVQLRRPHPRLKEGEGMSFTVPWTVTAAMKERGLLNDPHTAFAFLDRNAVRAMREQNRYAYGRTTEFRKVNVNGHSKVQRVTRKVKVDLYHLVYRGFRTRAGEVSPQISAYALNMGQATNGKHYALDWKGLYNAQQQVKAVWHLGLAYDLGQKAGIKCVPKGHSMRALGIDQKVKPKRTRQVRKRLKQMKARGPRARDRAARETRAPKPDVSWGQAIKNTVYQLRGAVERKITRLSKSRQRRFARQCVRAAVRFCSDSNLRFSTRDVKAAAAHMALPHVRPGVFVRAFRQEMARIEHLGVTKVRDLGGGQAEFTGAVQAQTERRAVKALTAGTYRTHGKLSSKQVARALAGRGHDARELRRVQSLVGSGGVTIDDAGLTKSHETRAAVIAAYEGNGRKVYRIDRTGGDGSFTPKEFVAAATRTPHMVALWRGLRTRGSLMDKLGVAEHIRRASPGGPKKGSLVIADARMTDSAEVARITKLVRKAKGHLLLVGEGAKELAPLVKQQRQHLNPQRKGPRL